jgi:uncharacterized protein (DUF169 family)
MKNVSQLYTRMIDAMGVEGLEIPAACVKLYRHEDVLPPFLDQYYPDGETVTSCQAVRHASLGHPVNLNLDTIGCIAVAVSLGLVDQYQDIPLDDPSRVYTDLMRRQSESSRQFRPPSPNDFTSGIVYACRHAKKPQYCLFGSDDSGRFKDVDTARAAVAQMAAIQPPVMKNIFFFPPDGFEDGDLEPDVVVLNVRPVELTRIIQGYQFITGKPIQASMAGLRVVPSDLIAWPYLNQQINVSTYCLGARLLAGFEGDRMGIAIPYQEFDIVVSGIEQSRTGYPFSRYPGVAG